MVEFPFCLNLAAPPLNEESTQLYHSYTTYYVVPLLFYLSILLCVYFREKNCVVAEPIIQRVAKHVTRRMEIIQTDFGASNGWLQDSVVEQQVVDVDSKARKITTSRRKNHQMILGRLSMKGIGKKSLF